MHGFRELKTPNPFVAMCDKFDHTKGLIEITAIQISLDEGGTYPPVTHNVTKE